MQVGSGLGHCVGIGFAHPRFVNRSAFLTFFNYVFKCINKRCLRCIGVIRHLQDAKVARSYGSDAKGMGLDGARLMLGGGGVRFAFLHFCASVPYPYLLLSSVLTRVPGCVSVCIPFSFGGRLVEFVQLFCGEGTRQPDGCGRPPPKIQMGRQRTSLGPPGVEGGLFPMPTPPVTPPACLRRVVIEDVCDPIETQFEVFFLWRRGRIAGPPYLVPELVSELGSELAPNWSLN